MADSGSYTPETIRRRQLLGEQLMMGSVKQRKIEHPLQGAAQMAEALMGGLIARKARDEDKGYKSEAGEFYARALGAGSPAAAPAMQAASPGISTAPTNNKVYANDEPSPLDPPSGNDRDMAIRTMLAEAGNQGPQGMQAVASVLRNRATSGNFGGDTLPGVIQKPAQFEPWNTQAGRQKMAAMDPNSPQYQQAGQALEQAYAGQDPTMGATHFYAPKAQAALGRPAPKWDNGTGVDIKDHRFFGGAGTPQVTAGASPTDMSAQARPGMQPTQAPPQAPQAPDQQKALIAEMLRSKNPYVQQQGQTLAQALLQKQFATDTPEFTDIGEDAEGRKLKGFVSTKKQQVTPYNLPGTTGPATVTGLDGQPISVPAGQRKEVNQAVAKRRAEEALPPALDDVSKLRKEVQDLPSYKNLAQAAPVYKSMLDAAGRDNRAADVNLIYGMAKIMDPGSVVRESEMTVAQAIATLPQQLKATVESQLSGTGRLSPEVREALMQEAHSRIGSYKGMFDQDAGMYKGIASRRRMNEADVLPSFGDFQPYKRAEPPAPATPAQQAPAMPQPGAVQQGYRFKGGNPGDPKSWEKVN